MKVCLTVEVHADVQARKVINCFNYPLESIPANSRVTGKRLLFSKRIPSATELVSNPAKDAPPGKRVAQPLLGHFSQAAR